MQQVVFFPNRDFPVNLGPFEELCGFQQKELWPKFNSLKSPYSGCSTLQSYNSYARMCLCQLLVLWFKK